ncbi:MAG: FtsW/RodA/SpoVE family cell cycle protein, partial [Acidimicrobiales bacterium]
MSTTTRPTRPTRPTPVALVDPKGTVLPPPTRTGAGAGPALLGVLVGTLCVIGLVMVLSASSVQALREQGSSWMFFRRQLIWVALGATAMVVTARIDYRRWRRLGLLVLLASVAMLVAVLIPGVGISVGGSARWLGSNGWRVQPSELAKLGLLIFSADLLARLQRGPSLRPAMWGTLAAFGLVAALVLLQPDMGTTLILGAIAMSVLFAAGVALRPMAGLGLVAAAAAVVIGVVEPYRRVRLLSFRNPWADASNTGYQVVQSLVGLGTGRVTGVGVGASRAKWGFLPNAHT